MSDDLTQTNKRPASRISPSTNQQRNNQSTYTSTSSTPPTTEEKLDRSRAPNQDSESDDESINQSLIDTGSSTLSSQSANTSQSIDAINQSINLLAVQSNKQPKRSLFSPTILNTQPNPSPSRSTSQSNKHSTKQLANQSSNESVNQTDEHALVAADLLSFRDVVNNRNSSPSALTTDRTSQSSRPASRSSDNIDESKRHDQSILHSINLTNKHSTAQTFKQENTESPRRTPHPSVTQGTAHTGEYSHNEQDNNAANQADHSDAASHDSDVEDELMGTGSSSVHSTGDINTTSESAIHQSLIQTAPHSLSSHSNNPPLTKSMLRSKRRKLEEIPLRERWRCKNPQCMREYKRTSTTSIGVHIETCAKRTNLVHQSINQSMGQLNPSLGQLTQPLTQLQINQLHGQMASQPMSHMNHIPGQAGSQLPNPAIGQPMMSVNPQMVMNGVMQQPMGHAINQPMMNQAGEIQYYASMQPQQVAQPVNPAMNQPMNGQDVKYVQFMAPMYQPMSQSMPQAINQPMMIHAQPQQLVYAQQPASQPMYQNGQVMYQPMPGYAPAMTQAAPQPANPSPNPTLSQANDLLTMSGGSQTTSQPSNQPVMQYATVMGQTVANQSTNPSLAQPMQYFYPAVVQPQSYQPHQ